MTSLPFCTALTTAFLLIGCDRAAKSTSDVSGHFESSSLQDFTADSSKQRATAEWEPSRGVVISQLLVTRYNKVDLAAAILKSGVEKLWIVVPRSSKEPLSSSIYRELRKAVGDDLARVELVPQQHGGDATVWARDWAPQGALSESGGLKLLDFNYFPERDADDYTAQTMERLLNFDRISVPIYNEGGNFMANAKRHCLMTTRVTDANAEKEVEADTVMGSGEIQKYYGEAAGCTSVDILERMPYEGTGHIDMWAKFLDDETIIVSELRDEVLALYTSDKSRAKAKEIQVFLETRAKEMAALGFRVVRVPMPGPIFDGKEVFRSYTNSLAVNGSILVPRYLKPEEDDIANWSGKYFDQKLLAAYELEIQKVYEQYGYRFRWIPSDDLIYNGGAVHCTTMQLPL